MQDKYSELKLYIILIGAFILSAAGLFIFEKSVKKTPDNVEYAESPMLSHRPGFYENDFDLEILYIPGWTIHYTTDGSVPNEESPVYDSPIRVYDRSPEPNYYRSIPNFTADWYVDEIDMTPVSKAFIIRAIAFGPEGAVSDVTTASYFVGQRDDGTAVASVIADPDDLFGDDGIHVTGRAYDEWYQGDREGEAPEKNYNIRDDERPATIELFSDGDLMLMQNVGIRIQGASQREARYKRLSVFSRKEYSGNKTFETEIFSGKKTHSFSFRSGFENAFGMAVAADRNVASLKSIPVKVYLNGEFWYDSYIQERYNGTFFKETYGAHEVEFIKHGYTDEIMDFLENHDLSVNENYREFDGMIDIQSFIDYLCINIYLGNADYSDYDNIAMWRSVTRSSYNPYEDGRWRYCLHDLDLYTGPVRYELGYESDAEYDSFHHMVDWSKPVCEWPMFVALKQNDGFCRQFVLSFMDIMNTDFRPERVAGLLEDWGKDISYNDYFFENRPGYITKYLAEEFELTGTMETLHIEVNDAKRGDIRVNTITPEPESKSWEGEYFTDYPVHLTAVPAKGYRFDGWKGDVKSTKQEIDITISSGGTEVYAVFEQEP